MNTHHPTPNAQTQKNYSLLLAVLTLSTFAIGTSQFVVAGLLPIISSDLGISLGLAGLLVTSFAIGNILSPFFVALVSKFSRRKVMLSLLLIFSLTHAVAAFNNHFFLLILLRVIGAVVAGMFGALALSLCNDMVAEEKKGMALAIILGGFSIANILGVPIGILIAQRWSWQASFECIAILTFIAWILNFMLIPRNLPSVATKLKDQLVLLTHRSVLMTILFTLLSSAGVFVMYTYLVAYLENGLGFNKSFTSPILLAYGFMNIVGNFLGGKIANRHPLMRLPFIFGAQIISLIVLYIFSSSLIGSIIGVMMLGCTMALGSASILRIFFDYAEKIDPNTKDFASSLSPCAINIGVAVGASIGGMAVNYLSVLDLPWIGCIFIALAIAAVKILAYQDRHLTAH
jgi:DHA1 family inner membrane transport protein